MMNSCAHASHGEHFVQFYRNEHFLLQRLTDFVTAGIQAGEGVVVIATGAHLQALNQALGSQVPLTCMAAQAYIGLDAGTTLACFMRQQRPDRRLFQSILADIIARASDHGKRRVRAFGEMVALLCIEGHSDAALELEALWNEAAQHHEFSLLCAYPMSTFPSEEHSRAFAEICALHSHVWPLENDGLPSPDEDAAHRRIALLEQKAYSLELEIKRRKSIEQTLNERENMLLERTAELLSKNERLRFEVDKRRDTEAALVRAQHILTSAERISHLGSWEYDANTRQLQCSDEFFRICGLTPQSVQMTMERVMSLVHPEDQALALRAVEQTLYQGNHYRINKRIVRPSGEIRYVVGRGEPVFEQQRLCKVIGSFLDVTEQQMAQQALAESEGRFRSLVNLSSDWYWEQDEQMRFTSLLHHDDEQAGATLSPMLGHTLWEAQGASWKAADKERLVAAQASRLPFHDIEYAYGGRNGEMISLQISGEPVYNAAGGFAGYRGIGKDVTQRVRREKELYLFRSAMDATIDAVFLFDRRGRPFFDVNQTACNMLGYTRDELLALTPEALGSRTTQELDWLYQDNDALQQSRIVETWLERRDGSAVQVELERRRLQWDNAWIIVAVARDITRRKRAEQALRESRETLRGLAAHQQHIKEEERKRIAREVHDELGGLLACIKAYVSVAIENSSQDGATPDSLLVDAVDLADTAIESVRRVITELRPSILDDLGIWPALQWYAKQLNTRTELQCACMIDASALAVEVDPERSTMLFRVVQEALTNVVRHAEASSVEVRVRRLEDVLAVEIEDNGKGIAPDRLINRESWGVLGMHERAAYFGAELKITGMPARGTLVAMSLPLGLMNGQ
jgi:PAS domain S-box-containing protein